MTSTLQPGKTNALNLGDACCRGFPRAYLDADIELDASRAAGMQCRVLPHRRACSVLSRLAATVCVRGELLSVTCRVVPLRHYGAS